MLSQTEHKQTDSRSQENPNQNDPIALRWARWFCWTVYYCCFRRDDCIKNACFNVRYFANLKKYSAQICNTAGRCILQTRCIPDLLAPGNSCTVSQSVGRVCCAGEVHFWPSWRVNRVVGGYEMITCSLLRTGQRYLCATDDYFGWMHFPWHPFWFCSSCCCARTI